MKDLRENAGKRAEEIALELDIAVSTVRFWEQGRHEPRIPISKVPEFLKAYNCSIDEAIEASKESQRQFAKKQSQ